MGTPRVQPANFPAHHAGPLCCRPLAQCTPRHAGNRLHSLAGVRLSVTILSHHRELYVDGRIACLKRRRVFVMWAWGTRATKQASPRSLKWRRKPSAHHHAYRYSCATWSRVASLQPSSGCHFKKKGDVAHSTPITEAASRR